MESYHGLAQWHCFGDLLDEVTFFELTDIGEFDDN
jgi:hypothetical protein